jgi:hypothetical protein
LLEELEFYEVRTNAIGMLFYAAQTGRHDDTISALLLAWYGVQQLASNMEVILLGAAIKEDNSNIYNLVYGDDDEE